MANPARVSRALNEAPMSAYRVLALILCGLVTVIDGMDYVVIGVVAPLMMDDFGLTSGQLGAVIAATGVGAAIGAVALGKCADLYGRRIMIIISLLLIALFTAMTAIVDSFGALLPVRFLVGVALTGALPATLALASELAPAKHRATILALIVAGLPAGGAIGTKLGGTIGNASSWETVFLLAAILPAVFAMILYFLLPESPRWLALNDYRGTKAGATLRKLVPNFDISDLWTPISKRFVTAEERVSNQVSPSLGALLADNRSRATYMLWAMLFCSGVLSNVSLVWLPTLYSEAGFDPAYAVQVGTVLNIGAMLGMATAGKVLELIGARLTIGIAFLVAALGMGMVGLSETATVGQSSLFAGLAGYFLGITTSAGYALSALIYPPKLRGTGVGAGAAALRIGTLIAPIVIPILLAYGLGLKWNFIAIALVPLIAALLATRFGAGTGKRQAG